MFDPYHAFFFKSKTLEAQTSLKELLRVKLFGRKKTFLL